jgi:hypothetical protein
MVAGESSATPMAHNRFILPTTILITILLAWAVVGRLAKHTAAPIPAPAVDAPAQGLEQQPSASANTTPRPIATEAREPALTAATPS